MSVRSSLLFACILSSSLVSLSQNAGWEQLASDIRESLVETPDPFVLILVL